MRWTKRFSEARKLPASGTEEHLRSVHIGVLTSHPIQYQAPYYRALAEACDLDVYFAHRPTAEQQGKGFGDAFTWDIDLLSGYRHKFLTNVSPAPGTSGFAGCDTPEISDIVAQGNFDVFIVSGWFLKSYWQAIRACRRQRVPVLARGDSQLQTPRSLGRRAVKQIVHRAALRQFDGFLSVGSRNAQYLMHYGVRQERIFFVPHSVDNEWFASRAREERRRRCEIRREWRIGDNGVVALFVGKFIPEKRVDDLVSAAALLKHDPRLHTVFVGSGPLEKAMRDLSAEAAIPARFEGFKNQTELPRYYASADALVLPSVSETWGLAVNEAMASGLPAIVSSAVGCAPDMIVEGETGFTYSVGQPKSLAAKLKRMIDMKAAHHDFEPAVLRKAAEFSIESAVAGTLEGARAVGCGRNS